MAGHGFVKKISDKFSGELKNKWQGNLFKKNFTKNTGRISVEIAEEIPMKN